MKYGSILLTSSSPYDDKHEIICCSCGKREWAWFAGNLYFCMKCVRKWKNNPSYRYDLDLE